MRLCILSYIPGMVSPENRHKHVLVKPLKILTLILVPPYFLGIDPVVIVFHFILILSPLRWQLRGSKRWSIEKVLCSVISKPHTYDPKIVTDQEDCVRFRLFSIVEIIPRFHQTSQSHHLFWNGRKGPLGDGYISGSCAWDLDYSTSTHPKF